MELLLICKLMDYSTFPHCPYTLPGSLAGAQQGVGRRTSLPS